MLGYQHRKMTRWYFETSTRMGFPDIKFTGFNDLRAEIRVELICCEIFCGHVFISYVWIKIKNKYSNIHTQDL